MFLHENPVKTPSEKLDAFFHFKLKKSDWKPDKQNPEKLPYLLKNARLQKAGTSFPNVVFESTEYLKSKV